MDNSKLLRYISLIALLLMTSSTLFVGQVSAHSPSDMELGYDKENSELSITISHSVGDRNSHYIEEIIIEKNGEDYDTGTYDSQPDDEEFTYTYNVDAGEGDTINVLANCNQGGDIESTIEITEEGVEEKDDGLPSISLITSLTVVIVSAVLYKRWKGKLD